MPKRSRASRRRFFVCGPQRHGKHPAQPRQELLIPLEKGVENDLGVAMGRKPVAQGFELFPQVSMVVDFPVEDQNRVPILAEHGLIAGVQINDLQADRTEGNVGRLVGGLLVRPRWTSE